MRTRLNSYLDAVTVVEVLPLRAIVAPSRPLRNDLGDLSSLAESIRRSGLLEPIVVRPLRTESKFEIVAGHRRYLACKANRMSEIRAIVLDLSDREAFQISLEENLQRKTLDPIEEAKCFESYVHQYGYGSVTELGKIIGKSKEYVSHRIRLLSLPDDIQEKVRRRLLTCSDAWEITRIEGAKDQERAAEITIAKSLTVKELRRIANLSKRTLTKGSEKEQPNPLDYDVASRSNAEKRSKIRSTASTALRIAMIRIDNLLDSLSVNDGDLKQELMRLRLSVHDLVGDYMTSTHQNKEPAESQSKSLEEITSMINDRYVTSFNSLNIGEVSRVRSKRNFSMFDDFPPFNIFDYSGSIRHDERLFRTIDKRNYEIEDLRVQLLGERNVALATFLSTDWMKVGSSIYTLRSRVTFVFMHENKDDGWKIVHEHWSQADPSEDVLTNMRGLEGQVKLALQ